MEFVIIEIGSPEWEYLWNWLINHPLNEGLEQPDIALNEGEAWQYTGSYKQGDKVIHTMRHRLHPVTQKLEQISLYASNEFESSQIKKSFKI
jgi:hypothetical protein